ncbi:MAG: polyprenyl diphosphate synthase [Candidatus Nealsonbacteria bacterium]
MKTKIPYHIGIIIDGNRRWAKEKNLPSFRGHKKGFEQIKKIGEYAWNNGVKILTIYCFSTENWNRSKIEVTYLMQLLGSALNLKNIEYYHKKGIKIKIIGQKEKLLESLQKKIQEAEELTKNNENGFLNLAISYGGRSEIIFAIKKIIEKNIPSNEITEDLINKNLWTNDLPHPDLIIRSGGEQRLSNFLTWQSAYSEFYFIKKYWPDFSEKDLDYILLNYSDRQRRYGK